jgi:hypothetical protein
MHGTETDRNSWRIGFLRQREHHLLRPSRGLQNERLNMKYFLEVFIARDFLDDWTASLEEPPTLEEKVRD